MNKLDINNTHNGCAFLGVVLAVLLFLSADSWAWCENVSWKCNLGGYCWNGVLPSSLGQCSSAQAFLDYYASTNCRDVYCEVIGSPHCVKDGTNPYQDVLRCSTECEADSLKCINNGDTWTNTGASTCGGYSCKINNCKAADSTWLSTSIAACTGSNNYAIINTDSTCEHVGTCCPNDSIPSGNTCKWRCDSVLTTCNGRTGDLFGGVLPDTSVSAQDTTFSYQCYYNCSHSPNPDSSVYLVEGNIVLSGPSDSIPDGIKSQSTFNSVRTTTGGVYVYDYLSPSASEYIDSIAAMKCVEHLWRCVINNKYVYWYDNQEVPAGCTNIVRVK